MNMDWNRAKNRFIAKVITRFPSLAGGFIEAYAPWNSEDIPWTPFTKRLSDCTIAIVTTAGLHHRDQIPFSMIDGNGDPSNRTIDLRRPRSSLMITHDYYDHADADRDLNIVFPVDRLHEFVENGFIGALAEKAYSFMGHITGPHIGTLLNSTAPEVARRLVGDGVDAVLLTPG
jgi:D-proline reductase (dithiol) PrdB